MRFNFNPVAFSFITGTGFVTYGISESIPLTLIVSGSLLVIGAVYETTELVKR